MIDYKSKIDQIYIKIMILETIMSLESESDRNRRSNSAGLKSELLMIRFVGPNHMSLL